MTNNIVKSNNKSVWKELLSLARCNFDEPMARTDSGMLVNGFRDAYWTKLINTAPACYVDASRTPRLYAAIERFKDYNK